jgi:uncharacterized protein
METPDLAETRRIVLEALRGQSVRVYLFGSFARGDAVASSDIDVGVLPLVPLPAGELSAIRDAIEESLVVHPVDLVDLAAAPAALREKVMREGVLWSD